MAGRRQRQRPVQQRQHARRCGRRRDLLQPGQDHGELIAAQPRHRVRTAHAQADAARRFHQHGVALLVAQRVVDVLEIVEVDEQQRQLQALAPRLLDFLVQAVVEHVAVGQRGERVEIGLVPDQFGRGAAGGDVADQRQRAAVAAVGVEDRIGGQRGPQVAAILAQELEFVALGHALLAARDIALKDGAALLVHEGHQRLLQHFLDGVAQHLRHLRIDKAGARGGVDFPDAFLGIVDDAAEAFLAAFERGQLASASSSTTRMAWPLLSTLARSDTGSPAGCDGAASAGRTARAGRC
jgi:hypothetical protein